MNVCRLRPIPERFDSLENAHRRKDELNAENMVMRDQERQREMEWDAMSDHVPYAMPPTFTRIPTMGAFTTTITRCR